MTSRERFQIVRTAAGWHVRFQAANRRTVWTTEVYESERAAYRAIYILRNACGAREWVDIYHKDERTQS